MRPLMMMLCWLGWALTLSGQEKTPQQTLQQARWFAISGGLGNQLTAEGKAIATICQQTNGASVFRELVGSKDGVSQLYGLLGLQLVDAPEFRQELPRFVESKVEVQVLMGCIAGPRETREIARQIRERHWVLRQVPVPGGKHELQVREAGERQGGK